MRKSHEVFTDQTENGDSTVVYDRQLARGQPVMAKLETTIGDTPTVTVKLLGLRKVSGTWVTLATAVITTETTTYMYADPALARCKAFKLNLTLNTNVTVTHGYIGSGSVEN